MFYSEKLRLTISYESKNLITLIFIALIGLAPSQKPLYSIKFVYDGDTILTNTDQKVRYLGIDAPEIDYGVKKSEFMARAARDENIRLVEKRRVILEFDREKTDQFAFIDRIAPSGGE